MDAMTFISNGLDCRTEFNKEFINCKNNEERMKITIKHVRELNLITIINSDNKSISRSVQLRDQANQIFITEPKFPGKLQMDAIIETYTKSVAYAPTRSRELSLAYANRSAALFKAKLYEDCLRDIERALQLDYPSKLKAKLFARKAQTLIILNSSVNSESKKALEEARHWLEKMDLTGNGRKIVEKTLSNPEEMAGIEKPRKLLNDERNLPQVPNDNPKIPGASSAIKFGYSKKFGKHIIAARDIKPGEVLFVERAYAAVVDIEKSYTHCENCLKQTWSAIPCDHCVEAIYCSEICRDSAWIDHHDIECQVIGLVRGTPRMSLRLVVKAVKEAGGLQALKDQLAATKFTNGKLI